MEIWHYSRETGELLSRDIADPDPIDGGKCLLPAYATPIRPPYVPPGCVAIFNGGLSGVGHWRIELDVKQLAGLEMRGCAEFAAQVNSYVSSREDHGKARDVIMRVAEEVIESVVAPDLSEAEQQAVKDHARSLARAIIYGRGEN